MLEFITTCQRCCQEIQHTRSVLGRSFQTTRSGAAFGLLQSGGFQRELLRKLVGDPGHRVDSGLSPRQIQGLGGSSSPFCFWV